MKSLYEKHNKTLVCVTFNYSTKQIEYITHENYPDLPCISACTMSCSIPIIFEKFAYNGHYYIDGGIYDNLALHYPYSKGKEYPIAFNIQYAHEDFETLEKFNVYLYELYKIAINAGGKYKCELFKDRALIIEIQPKHINPLWSNNDVIDLLDMFSDGYNENIFKMNQKQSDDNTKEEDNHVESTQTKNIIEEEKISKN